MLKANLTLELRGGVSAYGPIDAKKTAQIVRMVNMQRGIAARHTQITRHFVENGTQVIILFVCISERNLNDLERLLLGIGAMAPYFGTPAKLLVLECS